MPKGRGAAEPVDNEKLYKVLGVEKDADAKRIKKAYFKLARVHHPDKGGDEEKFKEIQRAYDVLSDESKREIYDRYGEKGLESGGSPAPTSIFDLFNGGGGGRRSQRGPSKPEDIVITVDLTLADVYYGPTKQVSYKYTSAKKRNVCSTCGGQGAVMAQVRAGPGMIMQTQRQCPDCQGNGVSFEDQRQLKASKKIRIPKGIKNNEKIKLSAEGHQLPGAERGDVVVMCRVMKDRLFDRLGADLAMKKQLTLKEALCGFEFKIAHVSGTQLTVKSGLNEVISPGQLKMIPYWGLPQKGAYDVKGNLYIKFDILFPVPGSIKDKEAKTLEPILSALEYPEEQAQKVTLGMGVRVKLVNLNNAQFNGRLGRVIKEESRNGRWPIELDNGKKVAVPESCLKIIEETESKSSKKVEKMETEDEDYVEHEEVLMEKVQGEPKFTPYAARGEGYDEDEEEDQRMECRHM
eukprot:CAMPEP_0184487516 /NCGR_PEP_ID=MMETSP0113_2-20130426/10163_1 /TAXON_ID=91329 /ORGANISM="Norrisiella sphaerica, Strain BC52" /LENGTH=462 /DNA_ID=CAMNT_0026869855 /DNA_START=143 /DNA_END=1531 /DNA_ORIENTATION=-